MLLSALNLVGRCARSYDRSMKKRLGVLGGLAVAVAACSGGGSNNPSLPSMQTEGVSRVASPMSVAAPTPTATATLPPLVSTSSGKVDGAPGEFTPAISDTSTGGNGQTIDGLTCNPTMDDDNFHVHSFLGVLVNGNWVAIPYGVGMDQPGAPVSGFVNTAHCFYDIHTHDQSGYIHQESPSTASLSSSIYTLGNVLDVWGQSLTGNSFAGWSGIVRVFYGKVPLRTLEVTSYTEDTSDPHTLALYSHEAIWIEVGPPYVEAAQLPPVRFYTEY